MLLFMFKGGKSHIESCKCFFDINERIDKNVNLSVILNLEI